ncbi:MAG: ABC transporter ATP-binding protein [Candidatus Competibacteraceae bacterium]|nr:ABC transporter ATP-binding protein [Candidatus Competibacteraceae bacterium]
MSTIQVDQISKVWAASKAVDNISFSAPAGAFTVLLGPSGCGKSTTLRLLAGLEEVSSGRILIGERDVTRLPPAQRDLSMVFQNYALFPHLSVAENILFGLKVRKVPRAERQQRLRRTAELLSLSELLERRPSQLSGGQQQRVALGRAIIAEKPVCLMDEPLSNLDAKLRHEMRIEIRALQRKLGISMIYVTHDQAEAMSMADRVILLCNGRIEQDAPPDEIYQTPATLFAARFIGTPPMNILTLADGAGGAVIQGLAGPPVLTHNSAGLCLGVRPEDVQLGAADGLFATVRGVEYLGADSVVDCELGGQLLAVRTQGKTGLSVGDRVQVSWSTASVHVFDAASGHRRDLL